jgi:hypothetical protein
MKNLIVIIVCCLYSIGGVAQNNSTLHIFPENSLARVVVDTVTYRNTDVITERLIFQERIAEDTLGMTVFRASTLYLLFSPSIRFPGTWVESVANGFLIAINKDTFCITLPCCDNNACAVYDGFSYQGFPLIPLKYGGNDCVYSLGIKDTNNTQIIIEGLGKSGLSNLIRVNVYGSVLSKNPKPLQLPEDLGYIRIPLSKSYYTRYLKGSPVFTSDREKVIGIVSNIEYVESGEDIVDVLLVITFFHN